MNALQLIKGDLDENYIPEQVAEKLAELRRQADRFSENKEKAMKPDRVYIDGGFDMMHSGHYNAIR